MSDELSSPPTSPTPTPITNAKPYDDALLDSYAEEASAEPQTPEPEKPPVAEEKAEEPKTPDNKVEGEESKEEVPEAKATKDDKVEDGIEEIPVKRIINGKQVEFKIKDAVQAFVKQEEFNRNMDKRLSQVAQREQNWNKDVQAFKAQVDKIVGTARKGDFVSGIRALAKIALNGSGLDVVEFEKQYFEQLDKVSDVYKKMTPEQRETYFAKRRADEAEKRAKELEEEKTESSERSQLQARISSLQRQHGLSQEEFWSSYKELADLQVGEGKAFSSLEEITPEAVIYYSQALRHESKVIEAAGRFGISDDAILDEINIAISGYPDLSVDDIVGVMEVAGLAKRASPAVVENLNRKAQQSGAQFRKASSTKKEDAAQGYDKETLEFLYRNQPRSNARPQR